MSSREQIREYVRKVLHETKDDTAAVSDSESLVLSGRLSSLDIIDVLTFLETRFNFQIDPNEFDTAKFDSIDSIVAMVGKNRV